MGDEDDRDAAIADQQGHVPRRLGQVQRLSQQVPGMKQSVALNVDNPEVLIRLRVLLDPEKVAAVPVNRAPQRRHCPDPIAQNRCNGGRLVCGDVGQFEHHREIGRRRTHIDGQRVEVPRAEGNERTGGRHTVHGSRYVDGVSGTYSATMGDRGRLVLPAELWERAGLHEGRPVVLMEAPLGLLLLTREQLRDLVRSGLEGKGLLEHLLADRRAAASAEDFA